MKKMNEASMKKSNGGTVYKCNTCRSKYYFKFQAGWHIIFTGHTSWTESKW